MSQARNVLSKQTVGPMQAKEVARPDTSLHWIQFIEGLPTGIRWVIRSSLTLLT